MRRSYTVFALAITLAFLLAGCDSGLTGPDQVTSPDEQLTDPGSGATASVTQGPSNPGSSPVMRVEIPGASFPAVMYIDAETDLAVLLSPTEGLREPFTTDLCSGEDEGEVNAAFLQTVEKGTVEALFQADVFAWAYELPASVDGPGFVECDFLTGDALLASGEVSILNVNNAWDGADDRAEQFTLKANGRLSLADESGTTALNQKNTGVTNPDGELVLSDIRIRLSPDPRD